MKPIQMSAIALPLLIGTSGAAESAYPSAAELAGMDRAKFVAAVETISEGIWSQQALIFTRMDPTLIDVIPGREWQEEEREATGCIYDFFAERGGLTDYASVITETIASANYIEANQGVNFTTIAGHPEAIPETDLDEYGLSLTACGYIELQTRRMEESGLMDALFAAAME